jgi:prepilin-type N-terminal cleavage/methylation domain-containing protein
LDERTQKARGFTIIELLLAMAVFLVICGAMFELLQLSQRRYSTETQLSGSFQEVRLAMDQISRDVSDAGFPSAGMYSSSSNANLFAPAPVAWSPNYPASPCSLGVSCSPTPGDYDLILETTIPNAAGVPTLSWIRYQLKNDGTLYRGSVAKNGTDPVGSTSAAGVMVPFLVNVMNNAPVTAPSQFTQIQAQYPAMFFGGVSVPIFQYMCDTPAGTVACSSAGQYNAPKNIRDVDITLIVMTQQPDAQTHQLQLIELNGRGQRLNPAN